MRVELSKNNEKAILRIRQELAGKNPLKIILCPTPDKIVNIILNLYVSTDKVKKQTAPTQSKSIKDQFGTVYASVVAASEELGIYKRLIQLVLSGKRQSTGGYKFYAV